MRTRPVPTPPVQKVTGIELRVPVNELPISELQPVTTTPSQYISIKYVLPLCVPLTP
jgi:hypothetical protein